MQGSFLPTWPWHIFAVLWWFAFLRFLSGLRSPREEIQTHSNEIPFGNYSRSSQKCSDQGYSWGWEEGDVGIHIAHEAIPWWLHSLWKFFSSFVAMLRAPVMAVDRYCRYCISLQKCAVLEAFVALCGTSFVVGTLKIFSLLHVCIFRLSNVFL